MKPNENKFIPFFGGVKHLQNIFVEILMEADLMKRAESFEIELVGQIFSVFVKLKLKLMFSIFLLSVCCMRLIETRIFFCVCFIF